MGNRGRVESGSRVALIIFAITSAQILGSEVSIISVVRVLASIRVSLATIDIAIGAIVVVPNRSVS